ncbi:MAG: (2Fe-2S)-binding protein [Acidimicrobiales bacterium]|nr:(2Fe-2S)-binding protein [Acidimicrobiales bacterium]
MIICHCRNVNDSAVAAAIDEGICNVEELGDVCGIGAECGGCRPALAELLSARTGTPVEPALRTPSAVA